MCTKQAMPPALVVTQSKHFTVLIPISLQQCPAWIVWLSDDFSDQIVSLAHQDPIVHHRKSRDLTERDLTLVWGASDLAFTAFESPLREAAEEQQDGGHIVVIFATPTRVAVRALTIDESFIEELLMKGSSCGLNYSPRQNHTLKELKLAAKLRYDPYVWELDEVGRKVVLLMPRGASRPDQIGS